jgi:hypothetical protein
MEDHLDLRPVVRNMPLQWDVNAPDDGLSRPEPPLPFQHDRSVVTNSARKLYDGRYREIQQDLTCGKNVINNIFERELLTNEFMSSEHFRLTGKVVPTSGPWHGRIHEYWFPVQQAHLFRESEPGNREFTCFHTPSRLRGPASAILHSLTCAICSNLLCTCQAPLTPRQHSPYAFIIHAQEW